MEPDQKLLNEIQTFVESHPSKNHLYYFAHHHRLTFYHGKFGKDSRTALKPAEKNDDPKFDCSWCSKLIEYAMYGCTQCPFFLHKACAELPKEIKHHPSHESHSLILSTDQTAKKTCSGCNLPILRGPAYACKEENCGVILHRFCLELPPVIQHPHHPSHRLFLNHNSVDGSKRFDCLACSKDHSGLNYHCQTCDYNYCVRCIFKGATAAATARSDGARAHVLAYLVEQPSDCAGDECLSCGEEFSWRPVFRCNECRFSVHNHCVVPFATSVMPLTFRSKFHRHPLTLTNYYAEGDWILAHQICDICEVRILPVLSFYYCHECDFADDLTCALREVGMCFAHKLGNVVLDTSPVVIKNPALTVTEIIESITEDADQKTKLNDAVKEATSVKAKYQQDASGSTDQKEAFTHIMEIFKSKRDQDPVAGLSYYETGSQIIKVDDKYMISKNLAPVLKALFSKHGDFSEGSPLSPQGKTFIFMILCAAMYSLCSTKDAEINEFQLFTCWDCFQIAKQAGFKIDFAFNRLRNAMLAYFGIRSDTAPTDTAFAEFDNHMSNLRPEMEACQKRPAQRMATLLPISRSVRLNDTIEIVWTIKKVQNSWDEFWNDKSEPQVQGDTQNLWEESLSETSEAGQTKVSKDMLTMLTSDWQNNFIEKIKGFIVGQGDDPEVFTAQNGKVYCSRCKQLVEDTIYGCNSCESRYELPRKILCGFHNHNLFLGFKDKINKKVTDEALCIACELPVSDATDAMDETYHCTKCGIVLHMFCVLFPPEIKHPLHPTHSLLLEMDPEKSKKITCNACGEKCRGCGYGCQSCNFYLEVQCLFVEPTIQSQSHGKLLLLQEERPTHSPHDCFACGKKIPGPPFLRCPPCNISLHIQCPLPSTIARSLHEHTLALIPCYNGDDYDKEDCDFCKKKMNHGHPAYYCEECEYAAHSDCATRNDTNGVQGLK